MPVGEREEGITFLLHSFDLHWFVYVCSFLCFTLQQSESLSFLKRRKNGFWPYCQKAVDKGHFCICACVRVCMRVIERERIL